MDTIDLSAVKMDEVITVEHPAPEEPAAGQEAAPVAKVEEKKEAPPVICNRCGHKVGEKLFAEPTQQDKEDFMRALVTCSRFMKRYEIVKDQVYAVFRSRTVSEDEAIIHEFGTKYNTTTLDPAAMVMYLSKVSSVVSLERLIRVKVDGKPDDVCVYPEIDSACYTPAAGDTRTRHEIAVNKVIGGMGPLYTLLLKKYIEFNSLVETLTDKAGQPDFYKAT